VTDSHFEHAGGPSGVDFLRREWRVARIRSSGRCCEDGFRECGSIACRHRAPHGAIAARAPSLALSAGACVLAALRWQRPLRRPIVRCVGLAGRLAAGLYILWHPRALSRPYFFGKTHTPPYPLAQLTVMVRWNMDGRCAGSVMPGAHAARRMRRGRRGRGHGAGRVPLCACVSSSVRIWRWPYRDGERSPVLAGHNPSSLPFTIVALLAGVFGGAKVSSARCRGVNELGDR